MRVKNVLQNQKGNVLLYTMLVISVILATTIILTNLVVSNIKQSGILNSAQTAYYFAESGAEKILYSVRKMDLDEVWDGYELCDINDPSVGKCDCKLLDNSACVLNKDTSQTQEIKLDLLENQAIQFDVFDPARPDLGAALKYIDFEWDGTNNAFLEVKRLAWKPETSESGDIVVPLDAPLKQFKVTRPSSFPAKLDIQPEYIFQNYRISIKALNDDVNSLNVKLYNPQSVQMSFPSLWGVRSVGQFGNTSQSVLLKFLRNPVTMGLFNYVLFSEEQIVK